MTKSFYSYKDFLSKLNENSSKGNLSPDFTPHEEFHQYRWMKPEGGGWYYKLKDFKPCVLPKNQDFHKSLDPDLSKVVNFFHSKKIPTTPSCSGHFSHPEEWSQKFDSLEADAKKIQGTGLKLVDPEDGYSIIAKDPRYKLPWNKKAFVERATEHQKFGVLGFYDPGNFFSKKIAAEKIKNTQLKKDGGLTLFLTSPKSEQELKECWLRFTESVCKNPLAH